MTASSQLPAPNLMPLMRYRDLAAAMGWLEQAFGFEKQIAVADGDGAVIYGQMTYRGGLIMMGAVRDTDLDKLMRQPDEVGGVETQSCYLVVDDADEHYTRAVSQGADVVLELKSDGLGRRGYSCRDPEGHIWSFGTYNPGRSLTTAVAVAPQHAPEDPPASLQPSSRLLMGIAGVIFAAAAAGWLLYAGNTSPDFADANEADRAYAQLVKVRAEKRQADTRLAALQRELDAERQRHTAKNDAGSGDALAQEKAAREAAEKAVAELQEELRGEQAKREAAVEAERQRLAAAHGDISEQDALARAEALAKEKAGREEAEKALVSLRDQLRRDQAERDAAVEARRVLEEKLAALSGAPEAGPEAPEHAPQSHAPQSDAGGARTESEIAAGANQIETSATNRDDLSPDAAVDADAESLSKPRGPDTKRDRITRIIQRPRRTAPMSLKRYPTYVTDLKNVWPYSHWSQ